jgi:Siphovirus ReqiPepy6 Gp37-like protein
MTAGLSVSVRDADYQTLGRVDDFTSLAINPKFNDVGAWTLDLSAASEKVSLLDPEQNPGGGVLVRRNEQTLLSGPVTYFREGQSGEQPPTVTVGGVDDNIWLSRRVVWPVPANAIDNQTSVFYDLTPAAPVEDLMRTLVDVSMGAGARTERQVPHLTVPSSTGLGPTISYKSIRFETVLEILQKLSTLSKPSLSAAGALGFRIAQVDTDLEFQVYETVDHEDTAVFALGRGNLQDWEYTLAAPTATFLVLGAGRDAAFTGGPQVAAELFPFTRTDDYFPDVRAERFADVGQIDPTAPDADDQLAQRAQQEYDDAAGRITLAFKPRDTPLLRFGVDYQLGDVVTVVTPRRTIQDQASEISLTYTADEGEQIDVTVGAADGGYSRRTPGIYRRLKTIGDYLARLKVSK